MSTDEAGNNQLETVSDHPERKAEDSADEESEILEENITANNTLNVGKWECLYFFEDEVFRINKQGRVKFGLVTETADSYEDEDEDEPVDVIEKGQVRIVWYPEGEEEKKLESEVGLADRTLLPGDIVRRWTANMEEQCGYCRDIVMYADLKVLGTKFCIINVPTERLTPICEWTSDTAVVLGAWVGSIKDVEERAVLKCTTGSIIEITSDHMELFKDARSHFATDMYNPNVFYPGNVIVGRLDSMKKVKLITKDKPLPMNKKGNPRLCKFTVVNHYIEWVTVNWQCRAMSEGKSGELDDKPDYYIRRPVLDSLKKLNTYDACMLQINDRSYLTLTEQDTLMRKSIWDKQQAIKYKIVRKNQLRAWKESRDRMGVQPYALNVSTTNFIERLRKKMSLHDGDKALTGKMKKVSSTYCSSANASSVEKAKSKTAANSLVDRSNAKAVTSISDEEWLSDSDEDEDGETTVYEKIQKKLMEDADSSTTTISTCSSQSPINSPANTNVKKAGTIPAKKSFGKTLKRPFSAAFNSPFTNVPGDKLSTEALLTYSRATVVWQDGTVEKDIPSTQLYPIHHLDNHEFFPGDFVIPSKETSEPCFRDYGMVQTVDHAGRTARVKWFTTYINTDDPKPAYNGETEISVYDLKDHPDFQFRPGTMVVRVANFTGDNGIAGQIVDNFPDGRIKVSWVDASVSMCWPQDLFEVGQADNADLLESSDDGDSWETESENSELGEGNKRTAFKESDVLSNIERARIAIARLEEIFNVSPQLQSSQVMRKLLHVYKGCRYLDRLLDTSFFHEDNFMGLIERVRKGGSQSLFERCKDRKNRLFGETTPRKPDAEAETASSCATESMFSPRSGTKTCSTPLRESEANAETATEEGAAAIVANNTPAGQSFSTPPNTPNNMASMEKGNLMQSVMRNIEVAFNMTDQVMSIATENDSGNYSRNDVSSMSFTSSNFEFAISSVANNALQQHAQTDDMQSPSSASIVDNISSDMVCVRLCALLKEQLVKCINEIREKHYKEDKLSLNEIFVDNLLMLDEEQSVDYEEDVEMKSVQGTNNSDQEMPEKAAVAMPEKQETTATTSNEINLKKEEPAEILPAEILNSVGEHFQVLSSAPKSHKFHLTVFHPHNSQTYYKAIQREHRMLKNSLPPGVRIRVYEDRMDLLSVMMEGPKKTPYEDGLFFFDVQLGPDYPKSPPLCHYISYCTDRLNPNLYEDGKVCVSLLGTWSGRGTEMWSSKSTLLQLIVSIQGLILVDEPYFNEAGYEKQKGTPQGNENSRMYNEMAIIKLVQSVSKMLQKPPIVFREDVLEHFAKYGMQMHDRIKGWMALSQQKSQKDNVAASSDDVINAVGYIKPEFLLLPASRGFCLTLSGLLDTFKLKLMALTENAANGADSTASTSAAAAANATEQLGQDLPTPSAAIKPAE